jgi:hypothetical protein
MTVRPIAFTGAMVTALLEGRKTQTRRVASNIVFKPGINPRFTGLSAHRFAGEEWMIHGTGEASEPFRVPYAVGDLLYVRECWRTIIDWDTRSPREIADNHAIWPGHENAPLPRFYEADQFETGCVPFGMTSEPGRLRAAMHMPRVLSRLTLKVTDVRVERVKSISEADAVREGLKECSTGLPEDEPRIWGTPGPQGQFDPELAAYSPREAFRRLWDSINASRGYGWEENPWVIAISFEVIRQNVDDLLKGDAA